MRALRSVSIVVFACLGLATSAYATDVTVQGTTDIKDSGLVDDVLVPGFHAAYPQYTLKYIAVGTGAAITNAEAGQGDAVVTHAAAPEAAFVAGGYSAEPYGRAVFFGDYVIIGPAGDPAGVLAGAAHNASQAFSLIAHAGALGHARFVSRADASGTNIEEHTIWALATGVTTCDIPTGKSGGGEEPSAATGPCPATPAPPPWYIRTGLGQGPAVVATEQCNFGGDSTQDCYEITDRGTFNHQVLVGAVTHLQVVSDHNGAANPGGPNLLVNSFHAYAVNPDKFAAGTIDLTGAEAFINYLTSPALQSQLASYPSTTQPAFFADAAPGITAGSLPATVTAGGGFSLTGAIRNLVPGTPALDGVTVGLARTVSGGSASTVATNATDAGGGYHLSYTPNRTATYELDTPQITKIEIPGTPPFGDILNQGAKTLGAVAVVAKIHLTSATAAYRQAVVKGTALPSAERGAARITVLGRLSTRGDFVSVGSAALGATNTAFAVPVNLAPGNWQLEARYDDPGVVTSATSRIASVRVPGRSEIAIAHLEGAARHASMTVHVRPAPTSGGAVVKVFVRKSQGSGAFHQVKRIALTPGVASFTARLNLSHHLWQIRLEYRQAGHIDASFSRVRSVHVH